MRKEIFECDCGCGASATTGYEKNEWFILSQIQKNERSNNPKLERDFHFKTLKCLVKWSKKAEEIAARLTRSARDCGNVRGAIESNDLPGVYV